MRIRSQISDNGNLRTERANSADTGGPRREDEELKTEEERRLQSQPCVWRQSRKLLTRSYAEREISTITQTERGAEENTGKKRKFYKKSKIIIHIERDHCHT